MAEVTAAATYYIAEIYLDFSTALVDSERPSGLSEAEKVDYELVIEEEAFPFEERAIEVHEKNFELLAAGESVTNIALEVGFENTSAFIAMFHRCMGTTPTRYL